MLFTMSRTFEGFYSLALWCFFMLFVGTVIEILYYFCDKLVLVCCTSHCFLCKLVLSGLGTILKL